MAVSAELPSEAEAGPVHKREKVVTEKREKLDTEFLGLNLKGMVMICML